MRILSIGATGFIGKSTLEHLIKLGHEIIAFHHGERKPPAGAATEIHGDIGVFPNTARTSNRRVPM
jgi:uncharacterized protein YbjT (DUF2867 family)